ncbi:hypothetical protein DFR58_10150 [Anaerobacterium chartisolvens]|uniref:Uncharacterized protein n=1 Tax=Anaerobacterium chartisolvens TaxID=1297424 RepID=A0A369BJS6_9FIRM|nr:hypothetical protein [Anaerobacterium chartisolvens]RCX20848.1 hypothetical protein DFR58_10150 [Anaerobacterium chartisolvens]
MNMSFICEDCGKTYCRETYTASSLSSTKKYWREKEGTKFGMCPDCYKEYKKQQEQKASEKANLPQLTGSEKQVTWALKIRLEKYKILADMLPRLNEKGIETYEKLFQTTEAKWWIDHRDSTGRELMVIAAAMMPPEMEAEIKAEEEKEKKAEKEAQEKHILRPENATEEAYVEVRIEDSRVSVISKKDDRIIAICKGLGYDWSSGARRRTMSYKTGTAIDRAAEIGNKILNAGFPVLINNAEAREKAVNGTYLPECKRWVSCKTKGTYQGWLAISWDGRDDKLYSTARKLPQSAWSSPCVVIKPRYYAEVEEFARLFDFQFSPGALEIVENEKRVMAAAEVVEPVKVPEPEAKDGLREILASSADVLDDLKDN